MPLDFLFVLRSHRGQTRLLFPLELHLQNLGSWRAGPAGLMLFVSSCSLNLLGIQMGLGASLITRHISISYISCKGDKKPLVPDWLCWRGLPAASSISQIRRTDVSGCHSDQNGTNFSVQVGMSSCSLNHLDPSLLSGDPVLWLA